MALSSATKNRVKYGLGSQSAANELDSQLGYLAAGDVFYVDSGHANASDSSTRDGKDKDQPFATLNYAFTRVTASNGDTIIVMPGHAETTTAIAWNVAGVRVLGLGYGRNRPTFTATTAATDLINVTAANGQLINVRLVGAASGVTALLDGSSAATDFEMYGCELVSAATPLKLVTWSGQRPIIKDLVVTQSAGGVDYIVAFEAGVDGFVFENWRVMCQSGIDNGLLLSGAFAHLGYIMNDIVVVGLDTLLLSFASSIGIDGLVSNVHATYSAAQTSVEDGVAAATSVGVAFSEIYLSDATGKRTGRVPLTSAS